MVFKVFCDINVSCINSEKLNGNEDISYEFVPKFDDDKENWDPNGSKKNTVVSNFSLKSVNSEKELNNDDIDNKLQKKNISISENKEITSDKNSEKENELKEEETTEPKKEEKIDNNVKGNMKGKKSEFDTNVAKNISKIKTEAVDSSENDTTKLKEYITSENTVALLKKKEYLRKRHRIPLEDITHLFVQEEYLISPKRIRIIKDEKEKSPEVVTSDKKVTKSVVLKENDESIKKYNNSSNNSKENTHPIHKTPLSNISNRANINNNNNNNVKNSNNNKIINNIPPKPYIINVKKNKPVKRNIIPRKALKSKPNPFNVSARMLR